MPWKNGGGETREILVHPPGADTASFDWRISMARVGTDGPFSVFEGVDRTLALLDGEALELEIEGGGSHRLTPSSAPLAFAADAPTSARLPNGAIVDLNVMVRRGRFTAEVERLSPTVELPASPHPAVLFALGPVAVEAGSAGLMLDREDALLVEGEALRIVGGAGVLRIAIVPV